MQKEIWKDIKGYEGLYQVSNKGRIKSLKRVVYHSLKGRKTINERIMSTWFGNSGYETLRLTNARKEKTFTIHGLMAIVFLGHKNSSRKIVIDHIDNNKRNNNLENLQIISIRENNSKDKFRYNKTSKYTGVSWHKPSKKWEARIGINGEYKYLGCFVNELQASNAYQLALLKL